MLVIPRRAFFLWATAFGFAGCAQAFVPEEQVFVVLPPETGADAASQVPEDKDAGMLWVPPSEEEELPDGGAADDADSVDEQEADTGVDSGSDEEDPAPDAGGCLAPRAMCGGSCTNLDTSAQNCGACGHVCPGGAACDGAGHCLAPAKCSYDQRAGHDYLFCTTKRNWNDARKNCQSFGLDLALVSDEDENRFVTRGESQWLGFTDIDREGTFRFVVPGGGNQTQGAEVTFAPWAQGEPNNDNSCELGVFNCTREHCGEVRADGFWNDAQCSKASRAYVCESF